MNVVNDMLEILNRNRASEAVGVYSICSAHPMVIRASVRRAQKDGSLLLLEATVNQSNHLGGYTGMTPEMFLQMVHNIADEEGLPQQRVLFGADHVGPFPWAKCHSAEEAMQLAAHTAVAYINAGAIKIHLDPSEPLQGDELPLRPELIAERSAFLAKVVEEAARKRGGPDPVYIVGTEVPPPGGDQKAEGCHVTDPASVRQTLETIESAFQRNGLEEAWSRVIGIVVQPGVEFSLGDVKDFDPLEARPLTQALRQAGQIVGEAHSTDFQKASELRNMVAAGFGILKVGPWLTFAMREALWGLAEIENELVRIGFISSDNHSRFRETVEEVMMADPKWWRGSYKGSPAELAYQRVYSLLDRVRYYWPNPAIQRAQATMFENLRNVNGGIPLALLSQHMTTQVGPVREGRISSDPAELVLNKVERVIAHYAKACGLAR